MIRKTLLLILPAAMVMAGCTKKGEEPQPGPEPTPTPVVVSQITVNLESLEVSPDSLSVIDLQVTPADALIAIDDKGLCPDLSFESLKSAMNGSEVNAVTGVRIRKVAQVDSAGVKKPGAYLVTVSGDSSNIYLKDSVRMTYRTSKETLVSKGFDVISKASRTLPTQIQVQSDLVALKSDSVSTLSISVFPSGAKLNIGSDGKCEGLNLVLDGSSETPSEYHIAKVEETPNSQGGGYVVHIQADGNLPCRNDMTTLTLDTNDVNGAKTRLVSNPFAVSLGSGTLLDSVKIICGGTVYESVGICQDHHTFFLPEDADLKHLKTTFITNGMSVTADGNPVVSGETEIDYSRDVTFKVTSVSGEEKSYIVSAYDFDLPVLYIETPDHQPITSKEEWVKDAVAVLFNGDAVDTMPTSIKGRGNSTWGNPKKPYTLKLDKKTEVLGMPEDKRWNLLANYFDRTLIRNAVAFEIARQTGLAWTPRGRHVEVIMNGSHQGNYYLCEHIKVSKNRIDIKEMKSDDTTGKKITGGYVVELDFRYDEVNKFKTTKRKLPVNIKSPDDDVMVPSQLAYIRNYFDSLEAVLYTDDFTEKRKYLDYIDVNSFIDWWIAYELTETNEPTGPLSSYMYKDRGGKLCAGPVWDFDIKTFLPDVNHFRIKDAIYYTQLFKDDIFMEAVKVRWNNHKPGFESVCTYIDKIAGIVEKSDSRNHDMWPLPSHLPSWAENGDGHLSFPDAVARLKGAYQQRLQWLDEHINAL